MNPAELVPRSEIDDLYLVRPYYIVPDGKAGHDAYAVIRETIKSLDKVAIARVVLTNREHIIALEAGDKGLMGMLLRYPYEVREASEYFDGIQDVKLTKDMLDLARHIVDQRSGHLTSSKTIMKQRSELLTKKQKGLPITAAKKTTPDNVVNLMDALRASIGQKEKPAPTPARRKAPAKKVARSKKSA
jgi:DNA end-binding protein Ku